MDTLVNGTDNSDRIDSIDEAIFLSRSPKLFMGSESVEVKYDKQFENTCLLIAQKTSMDAKKMTVLQFYNAVDNIKRQAEAEMKSMKPKRQK